MLILCDLKGQCLNHEYIGAECSKLRQPMCAIFVLSRAQLQLLVVTRSRDLSRECHVTNIKRRQGVISHCPISKILGPFNSAHRAVQVEGCAPNFLKKGRTLLPPSLNTEVVSSLLLSFTLISFKHHK